MLSAPPAEDTAGCLSTVPVGPHAPHILLILESSRSVRLKDDPADVFRRVNNETGFFSLFF